MVLISWSCLWISIYPYNSFLLLGGGVIALVNYSYFSKCNVCGVQWIVYRKPIRCINCNSGNVAIMPMDDIKSFDVLTDETSS